MTASLKFPASRKKAAAYSSVWSVRLIDTVVEEVRLTKSPFAHQCICVLQRCGLPSRIPEIVRQKLLRRRLFSVPGCHSPKTKEYVFLLQRQVVKTAVNGIFFVCLGVFITGNVFELCPLGMQNQPVALALGLRGLPKKKHLSST